MSCESTIRNWENHIFSRRRDRIINRLPRIEKRCAAKINFRLVTLKALNLVESIGETGSFPVDLDLLKKGHEDLDT